MIYCLLASHGKAEDDLDVFDTDGFIVDDPEYEEDGEEESRKQAQKKKKRLYNPVMQFHTSALFIQQGPFGTHFQEILGNHCS